MIITPSLFGPQQALLIILYCVLGGVQYFWGAAVGAIVLSLLPIYFDWLNDWYMIVYGLLFVVADDRAAAGAHRAFRRRPARPAPATAARPVRRRRAGA